MAVARHASAGSIDRTGKVVIRAQYDGAENFSNGMAAVVKDKQWSFIDHRGAEIIRPQAWG